MKRILVLWLIFQTFLTVGQNLGEISGKIIDSKTRETIPYVNVLVYGTSIGAVSDDEGNFRITNVPLGYNKLQVSFVGYQSLITDEYLVTKDNSPYITVVLKENLTTLKEVEIKANLFKKSIESPLSLQTLGVAEIEKNPGGNRDVLKVIQSFPGVASNPGFRNDIIIRGGATSENKFYLDGIEVPVINHFQTQGATGGPVGIMNADLIRKVDFYSSAFPANRGNTLSSVIEFTQKVGNNKSLNTRATLGTSDAGITLDGPIGDKTTFMLSVRQSYLQFLFKLIKLPFLPTYNDFQLNVKSELSKNSELSIIALGAIDDFELNETVNDGETDEETIKRNKVILNTVPVNSQWNYTVGASYKYFAEETTHLVVLSRNELKNKAIKYFMNEEIAPNLLLNYSSKETETKFRYELNLDTKNNYKINIGSNLETATYLNDTYRKVANSQGVFEDVFNSEIDFIRYGIFGQISKEYLNNKLGISFGFRLDGVDYNSEMRNVFNQFSPRLSLNYLLTDKWSVNGSIGRYYQLPSYTVLGFKNNAGEFVNKKGLKYIQSDHIVAGLLYRPNTSSKVTFEAFHKSYDNYPFSVRDQISLANLGDDFGVVGNEEVVSNSQGRSYGFEFLAQKKSYDGLYGIASYTFVRSEFKNALGQYIPSTWDNRHLITITAGKKLKKNWEIGTKFRLVGGKPFTPYDLNASSLISNYDVRNGGVLDYTKLNEERLDTYTQLDFRVDKTWYLKRAAINLYLDIQNVYASSSKQRPFLLPIEDQNGRVIDPNDSSRYLLEEVESNTGRALPRIGVIVDF
ncbi:MULTISPECIES: TonB-dependent receptor [unclassified Tenacibaculum]|uniref:TonB-dependent receptor n=1 Tax=unclassified Tenacibaculum TaxID=2635139 RepID=UPI001F44D1BB|nr:MULTISPECIES: TonB-dependent receptor [unclassified Tenacibaculum]MCF2876238.1 TonB-dependent receptor [Tenacibaculum sp. Cn5-1]MCF2936313.1 TonB-dependent receptor [Tenacibaculum sp. Cn5-34]MCG7511656.1 TonB-dependent receptor [Tenacibaculum sp. Cn5-46]